MNDRIESPDVVETVEVSIVPREINVSANKILVRLRLPGCRSAHGLRMVEPDGRRYWSWAMNGGPIAGFSALDALANACCAPGKWRRATSDGNARFSTASDRREVIRVDPVRPARF